MAARTFTAYIEYDPDTGLYVGIVPGIPGAHTQGETLDELRANLQDVLALPSHSGRDLARPLLREILREIELTPEQFQAELKRA